MLVPEARSNEQGKGNTMNGSDYQIVNGHAVPVSDLARAIHARLLDALARSSVSDLMDGTRPVGKVRMGWTFDGPDAGGWFKGKVRIDAETLDYQFPPGESTATDPLGLLTGAVLDAPIEVAIDQWGGLVFRAEGRCSSDLPDFQVRSFSPILRSQTEAR
jgi:hypothetical protein